ncbi:MAG: protease SohB [Pseudomonadota bacterium]
MSGFVGEYALFLAKVVTFLLAVFVLLAMVAGFSKRAHHSETLRVEKLNDKFRQMTNRLRRAVSSPAAAKALKKQQKADSKARKKSEAQRPRTYLIDFKGDIKASAVSSLREEISAVLAVASPEDELLVRLENPGGVVHEHGLAAAQLARVRDAGIRLVVSVDKVAASGGYLMACVADRIIAAPFAIVGSIGVIAQLPNFNRLLDEKGVDFEQITAGKYKRTVTMFGKNTDADRAKLKQELEDIHALFQAAVARYRPDLDLEKVATGEHWYGTQAQDLGLIDEIVTSDSWVIAALGERDIFSVKYEIKQPLPKKLMGAVDSAVDNAINRLRGAVAGLRQGW